MAWTAPRDWTAISGGIVTAASLNTDVRDNLGVLSTHAHTGGDVGQGASTMTGLTLTALGTLTFADSGAPTSAGELKRHGNDLKFYGSSAVNLTAADQAAGTASLRTLSTTSTTAAAGDHTHVPASQATGLSDGYQTSGTRDNDDEVDNDSLAMTPGAAGRAWVVTASVRPTALATNDYTYRLYYDTTLLQTISPASAAAERLWVLSGFVASPTVAEHTVKVSSQRTSGGSSFYIMSTLSIREVSA